MPPSTISRRDLLRGAVTLGGAMATVGIHAPFAFAASPYRPFSDVSEWTRTLPADAPVDPGSTQMIASLNALNPSKAYPRLTIGSWAEPIYWATSGDPSYVLPGWPVPSVRIPLGAKPAPTSDGQMTIFDLGNDWVIKLSKASFDGTTWKSAGTEWYRLSSNGLMRTLPESDDSRNTGHRGYPCGLHGVRWDEVQAGSIAHVLKVALATTAPFHVYPGAGHTSTGTGTIPQGAILRIKPSVDLPGRNLNAAALTIARSMQSYGVVVGDQGGVPMSLKLEGLETEGRPERWSQLGLAQTSFAGKIAFDDFEVIQLGYHRP
jgi:hypothetical protein